MSAAEEDTELRDLLIHTLENNGVLNKIKAELRASVFLALEEQERAENKPSLINESLRQLLATRDGRLLSGLLTDFLQHFHLDFTLAVLQPEACLPSTPEDRTAITRELGLPEAGGKAPLLLELLRCYRQRDSVRPPAQELPPEYTAEARAQFRLRSRAGSGEVGEMELRAIMAELCPHFPGNMLERYITDELAGREPGIDEQGFLAMYRRLYLHCRSVVSREPPEDSTPREAPQPDDSKLDEDDLEGDSFFDDPIPKPEKTYGWKEEVSRAHPGSSLSQSPPSGSPRVTDQDRELRSTSEKMGAGNDDDYMDDFQSSSQRSEKSEASIGEDLEGELSVEDLTASEPRLEELTLDNSLSHLSDVADYLEEVS